MIIKRAKKAMSFFAVVVILNLLLFSFPSTVHAVDFNKDSVTTVEIVPGPLKLTSVPSFNFDSQEYALNSRVIDLHFSGTLGISDARGNGSGWSLYAKMGNFYQVTTHGTYKTMLGARFNLGFNVTASPANINDPSSMNPSIPNKSNIEIDPMFFPTGDAVGTKILSMPPGVLFGKWQAEIDFAELYISAPPTPGQHKAIIYWILEDSP